MNSVLSDDSSPSGAHRTIGNEQPLAGADGGSATQLHISSPDHLRNTGQTSAAVPPTEAVASSTPAVAEHDRTVISQRPVAVPADFVRSLSLIELARTLEGRSLHHFSVDRMIGGGGMGAVFRGRDLRLDREVAIKVIPESKRDPETLRRFRMEAQSAAKLDHPNIARVYDIGEDETWNYIVFEFIDGINLRDLVQFNGPMTIDDAVFTTRQVAEALQHAHDREVVHRDIKPSNVIITPTGIAKVVDMGLARNTAMDRSTADQTASGVTLGTFDYISPEQARDPRDADVRSDLYSLGCTLFYMLTGQPPFPDGTALQKLLNHGSQPHPDPRQWRDDISDQLAAVLSKLMAKRPSDRYQKPVELINDLMLIAQLEGLARSRTAGTILMHPTIAKRSFLEHHLPWLVPLCVLIGSAFWLQSVDSFSEPLELPQPTLRASQSLRFQPAPPNTVPSVNASSTFQRPSDASAPIPSEPSTAVAPPTNPIGSPQISSSETVGQFPSSPLPSNISPARLPMPPGNTAPLASTTLSDLLARSNALPASVSGLESGRSAPSQSKLPTPPSPGLPSLGIPSLSVPKSDDAAREALGQKTPDPIAERSAERTVDRSQNETIIDRNAPSPTASSSPSLSPIVSPAVAAGPANTNTVSGNPNSALSNPTASTTTIPSSDSSGSESTKGTAAAGAIRPEKTSESPTPAVAEYAGERSANISPELLMVGKPPAGTANTSRWVPTLAAAMMQAAMQPEIRLIELHESIELTSAISIPRSGLTLRAAPGMPIEITLSGADAFGMGWESWFDVERKTLRCQGIRLTCLNDMRQSQAIFAARPGGRVELDDCVITMHGSRDAILGNCILVKDVPKSPNSAPSGNGNAASAGSGTVGPTALSTLMPTTSASSVMPMPSPMPSSLTTPGSINPAGSESAAPAIATAGSNAEEMEPVTLALRNSVVRGALTLITLRTFCRAEISLDNVCAMLEGRVLTIRSSEEARVPPVIRMNLLRSTLATQQGFAAVQTVAPTRTPLTLMRTAKLCAFWSPATVPHITVDGLSEKELLDKLLLLRGEENAYDQNIETLCMCRLADGQHFNFSLHELSGEWFRELGYENNLRWLSSMPPERAMESQQPTDYQLRDSMFMPGYRE